MNYRLVVLTHGDAPSLDDALLSFFERIRPIPTELMIVLDGADAREPDFISRDHEVWSRIRIHEPSGFCRTSRLAWEYATRHNPDAGTAPDYVFWLENDFVFTRDVDLEQLADTLAWNPDLAQMQLMRNAVNPVEQEAGGLYESRRDQYTERSTMFVQDGRVRALCPWLEHRSYMTTNPCLMTHKFMRDNPWPAEHEEECEGRFGIELLAAGYRFGVWGRGEPWVDHVGVRTGFGY